MQEIASTQSTGPKGDRLLVGFFHEGHRAASDGRATLHALAQPLPGTGRLALQALLAQARLPTCGYGREMLLSRRRMSSRREVTPGVRESLGARNAGIAMCRTRIRRQRCRGSEKT